MGAETALVAGALAALGSLERRSELKQQAGIADRNADIVAKNAARNVEAHRREARVAAGRLRAQIAASGAGFGSSAQDLARQSRLNSENDALALRRSAANQEENLRLEAQQAQRGAKFATFSAVTNLGFGYAGARSATEAERFNAMFLSKPQRAAALGAPTPLVPGGR